MKSKLTNPQRYFLLRLQMGKPSYASQWRTRDSLLSKGMIFAVEGEFGYRLTKAGHEALEEENHV